MFAVSPLFDRRYAMPLPVRISPSRDGDGLRAATHVQSSYQRKSDHRFAFGLPLEVFSIYAAVYSAVSPIRIQHQHKGSERNQGTRTRKCRRIRYPIVRIY